MRDATRYWFAWLLAAAVLVGCVVGGDGTTEEPPRSTAAPTVAPEVSRVRDALASCDLPPVAMPTRPAEIPGYARLDGATGLHVTGIVPEEIDLDGWRLEVTGAVESPLTLTLDELRCMAQVTGRPTLVCPGFFVDEAEWTGVPLRDVLAASGAPAAGVRVRLYGADGYDQQVPIETAMSPASYLAYEWEGEPLPFIHGFPLRAVFPGESGNLWVKWLYRIEVF